MTAARQLTRFNIELSDNLAEVVSELIKKTGLRTQKDVFENSLGLFAWAVREVSRGRIIASLDEETKTYAELHMPALMGISTSSLRPTVPVEHPEKSSVPPKVAALTPR